MKLQRDSEYKDRRKKSGHKERDCLKSYLKVRREMIHEYLQHLNRELTEEEIEQLARNARGMIVADIRESVDEYLRTARFPPRPSHPTNTCDPYTGNWAEHLMDPYHLAGILSRTGFDVEILGGYCGLSGNVIRRLLARGLNVGIRVFKKQGLRIAPFYTIHGRRD